MIEGTLFHGFSRAFFRACLAMFGDDLDDVEFLQMLFAILKAVVFPDPATTS